MSIGKIKKTSMALISRAGKISIAKFLVALSTMPLIYVMRFLYDLIYLTERQTVQEAQLALLGDMLCIFLGLIPCVIYLLLKLDQKSNIIDSLNKSLLEKENELQKSLKSRLSESNEHIKLIHEYRDLTKEALEKLSREAEKSNSPN